MADSSSLQTGSDNKERLKRVLLLFFVDQKQEDEWMLRYTKINTTELVFAVDVMTYAMLENKQRFKNFLNPKCPVRPLPMEFHGFSKKFIELTFLKFHLQATSMLERNVIRPTYSEFKTYANAAALKVESSSYSEYAYLVFCVMMAQVSIVAYVRGILEAPKFGIMLMCRTYSNFREKYDLPADSWNVIKRFMRESSRLLKSEYQILK